MSKEFSEALVGLSCANNFEPQARQEDSTQLRCYSKECCMNVDSEIASDIQSRGCRVFMADFVKAVVDRSAHLQHKLIFYK